MDPDGVDKMARRPVKPSRKNGVSIGLWPHVVVEQVSRSAIAFLAGQHQLTSADLFRWNVFARQKASRYRLLRECPDAQRTNVEGRAFESSGHMWLCSCEGFVALLKPRSRAAWLHFFHSPRVEVPRDRLGPVRQQLTCLACAWQGESYSSSRRGSDGIRGGRSQVAHR